MHSLRNMKGESLIIVVLLLAFTFLSCEDEESGASDQEMDASRVDTPEWDLQDIQADSDVLADTPSNDDPNQDEHDLDETADATHEWNPPFDGFGEPGWGSTDVPLCRETEIDRRDDSFVWANSVGVSLFVTTATFPPEFEVYHHDGSGWEQVLSEPIDEGEETDFLTNVQLAGAYNGPLWVFSDRHYLTIEPIDGVYHSVELQRAYAPYFVRSDLGYALAGLGRPYGHFDYLWLPLQ